MRSSKSKALKAWREIATAHGHVPLGIAVKNYAASPDALKDGGQFVPAMERWLKDGRWQNWVTAQAPPRPEDWS